MRVAALIASTFLLVGVILAVGVLGGFAAECGKASFYAEQHQGRPMANGRPFNMYAMTAASWSYPLGTRVSVTAGRKSVVVTITDRGPAHHLRRAIDLSKAAFEKLAPTAQGIINVCIARLP